MASVMVSAYSTTRPSTLRAARPMVWISDDAERRKPGLVGVEDGHQLDLGEVEALAQEVDAHQDVVLAQTQVAQELDAGDGVDVGVQVAHPHPQLERGSR